MSAEEKPRYWDCPECGAVNCSTYPTSSVTCEECHEVFATPELDFWADDDCCCIDDED